MPRRRQLPLHLLSAMLLLPIGCGGDASLDDAGGSDDDGTEEHLGPQDPKTPVGGVDAGVLDGRVELDASDRSARDARTFADSTSMVEPGSRAEAGQVDGGRQVDPGEPLERADSGRPPADAATSFDGGAKQLLAFPGAEGFGRLATGGRGGSVYHVTTLSDSGPGSLRDAVSAPKRTVVFDVSGIIKLESRLIFASNLTIAGQTAPGGGIVIYGNGTSFTNANDTIVRYVRFRMGVQGDSGKDTVAIARGQNMIFDHCSMSWGRDGTFDINQESGYELKNITLQDSIVAQGLLSHSTGGLLVGDGMSVLRSLYIDNHSRNPKARKTTQWVNNVIYNWVVSGYILGDTAGRSDGYMVGNYFITGPDTRGGTLNSPTASYHLFASANYLDNDKNGVLDGRLLGQDDFGAVTWHTVPSVPFPKVTELSASEAYEHVVSHAGASLWRDQVDQYLIDELTSVGKRGAIIHDETSLGLAGGVGSIPAGVAPPDTDRDGMPDAWESTHGLSATSPSDGNDDRDGDGYTNLEEYLDSLVRSGG